MPSKDSKVTLGEVIANYAQTKEQAVDCLVFVLGDQDGSKARDWFESQKSEGVDPEVAKAQAALEEAVEKANT